MGNSCRLWRFAAGVVVVVEPAIDLEWTNEDAQIQPILGKVLLGRGIPVFQFGVYFKKFQNHRRILSP